MRRYLAAGALIFTAGLGALFAVGGSGGGASSGGRVQRGVRYGGRAWPTGSSSAAASSDFIFSPSSSALTEDLCSTFSPEMAGAKSFCVHGDGGSTGLSMGSVGSPVSKSVAVCPNGSDCAAVAAQGTLPAAGFQTAANVDTAFGDVSWWFVTRKSGPDTSSTLALSKYNYSVTGERAFLTGINGSHLPNYSTFAANGSLVGLGVTCQAGFSVPQNGWSSVVVTRKSSDNSLRIYLDGQTCISGTNGAPLALAAMPVHVGMPFDGGPAGSDMDLRVGGQSEKTITLKAIRDFSAASAGTVTSSAGDLVYTDRGVLNLNTGNIACASSTGALSAPGTSQACIGNGYLWNNKAATNLIYKGSEFNGWSAGLDGTLTLNAGPDPFGSTRAALLSTATTSTGGRYLNGGILALTPSSPFTYSVYAQKKDVRYLRVDADNNYAMFDLNNGTVANSSGCTYESTAIPAVGALAWRLSIHFTSSGSGSTQLYVFQTSDPNNASYAGTAGQGTYLFGAQLESGSVTTPYVYAPGPTSTTGSVQRSRTWVATAFAATPTDLAATTFTNNIAQSAFIVDVTTKTQRVASLWLDAGVPLCTFGGADGGSQTLSAASTLTANTAQALSCSFGLDGGLSVCLAGTCRSIVQTIQLGATPCSISLGSNNFATNGSANDGSSFAGGLKLVSVSGAARRILTKIGALGDSLTARGPKQFYADSWLSQLAENQRTVFDTYNSAQGYFTTALIRTDEWPDLARWSPNYVAVFGGVNDLGLLGRTPLAIEADLDATYALVVGAGATPILFTIAPWRGSPLWTAPLQTDTDTVNTWIRARAVSGGWPIVDTAVGLSDGGQGLSPPFSGPDSIHPNDAGEYQIYTLVLAALDGGLPRRDMSPLARARRRPTEVLEHNVRRTQKGSRDQPRTAARANR